MNVYDKMEVLARAHEQGDPRAIKLSHYYDSTYPIICMWYEGMADIPRDGVVESTIDEIYSAFVNSM